METKKPERELNSASGRLDMASALAAVDGDEALLREVADAFISEAPRLMADALSAWDRRDAPAVKAAAHTLKGAIASFGSHPGAACALTVEQAAKAGDLTGAATALESLQKVLQPLLADLAVLAAGGILSSPTDSSFTAES